MVNSDSFSGMTGSTSRRISVATITQPSAKRYAPVEPSFGFNDRNKSWRVPSPDFLMRGYYKSLGQMSGWVTFLRLHTRLGRLFHRRGAPIARERAPGNGRVGRQH